MEAKLLLGAFLACLATVTCADDAYRIHFVAKSVMDEVFAPLRANKTMVLINECGKNVTEPYGILEHSYKIGSTNQDERCTWKLHAPDKYVVNVISILFIMEDEIPSSNKNDVRTSTISIYDGNKADEDKLLTRYYIKPEEKIGNFIRSTSSGQDMVVEIKYNENKDFATQKMLINYEFLDVDQMTALLRGLK